LSIGDLITILSISTMLLYSAFSAMLKSSYSYIKTAAELLRC